MYESWILPLKLRYEFDLREIRYKFFFVTEKFYPELNVVYVYGILEISLLCIDKSDDKKLVYIERAVGIEINPEEKVITGSLVFAESRKVKSGWDDKV